MKYIRYNILFRLIRFRLYKKSFYYKANLKIFLGLIFFWVTMLFNYSTMKNNRESTIPMLAFSAVSLVFFLIGLYEINTGRSFTDVENWWLNLKRWQRNIIVIITIIISLILMVLIMFFGEKWFF